MSGPSSLGALVGATIAVSVIALTLLLPEGWVLASDSSEARARAALAARRSRVALSPGDAHHRASRQGRAVSAEGFDPGPEDAASTLGSDGLAGPSRVEPSVVAPATDGDRRARTSIRPGASKFGFDFFSHFGATSAVRQGDGPFVDRFPDGSLAIEGHYQNGEREGEWTGYHTDGSLCLEGQYSAGKRVGRWKAYHPSGQLMGVGEYSEGLREGAWVLYYSNGLVKEQGFFEHDLRNGPWQYYDGFGQLEARSGYYRYGRMLDN